MPPRDGLWLPPFHPEYDGIALGLLLLGLYTIAIVDARRRGIDMPISWLRIVSYVLGALTIMAASSWPLHDLSENYLFSVHMAQHMLFIFVAAPLLLAGVPSWLLEILLEPQPLRSIVRFCARPVAAFLLFNAGQGLTHVPEVFDVIIRNHPVHFFTHMYILSTALLLWFPVLSAIPGMPRLSYPFQMVYLMAQSIVPTIIYAPLTYSEAPVYQFYAEAPRIWGMSVLHDQQMAGLLMKILGGIIIWIWIAAIFFIWFAKSNKAAAHDDFAPIEELTPRSAVRAAEEMLHKPRE